MIAQLSISLMLVLFVVLMTIWIVRQEEKPKKKPTLHDPKKSYKKAISRGLNFPNEDSGALGI